MTQEYDVMKRVLFINHADFEGKLSFDFMTDRHAFNETETKTKIVQ
jgi:hypothetical protein